MGDRDPIAALHDDLPDPPKSPMLQMDGIRVATLAVLAIDTLVVVLLAMFLVNNAQDQREVNECYQELIDDLAAWANSAVPAGVQDRQAQRELLTAQPRTPEEWDVVRGRYLSKLDEADRTRSTAAVPTQRCAR